MHFHYSIQLSLRISCFLKQVNPQQMTKLQNKVVLKIKITLYVGLIVMKNLCLYDPLILSHSRRLYFPDIHRTSRTRLRIFLFQPSVRFSLSLLAFQHMSCYFVLVILNFLLLSYFIPLVSMPL